MEKLTHNLATVRARIAAAAARSGRDPADVTVVAVSKGVDVATMEAAVAAGITDVGENRIQEAERKITQSETLQGDGVRRHMIGTLQTNKVRHALRLFDMIHSLDRPNLGAAISRRASASGMTMPVLVQVNVSGEATRHGVSPEELLPFIRDMASLPGLAIKGLMTMAPYTDDAETVRPVFRQLRQLATEVAAADIEGVRMHCLSMGMTNDFEVAVEEGATIVRIGTALFGARPT